jgi:hypothetical protein
MADDSRYPPSREPTPEEWRVREAFLASGRSVFATCVALDMDRRDVLDALEVCRLYRQDSGFDARFKLAKRHGFSDADAELHADQVADFYRRTVLGK